MIIGSGIFYLSRGLKIGENVELKGVDIANIEDGIYLGEYEAGRWSNKLEIVIQNNKIIKIDIVDDKHQLELVIKNLMLILLMKLQK